MPKNTRSGASYEGLVDVSPSDVDLPEWAEPVAEEAQPEPEAEKPKAKRSTTAKAGAAKGSGSTRS